jgi:hypothetical protein
MTDFELLLDPTPILTETPDDPEIQLTEEEQILKNNKEKALKCKVIALNRMGHHPILANVSNFNKKSKKQLLDLVKQLFDKPMEELDPEFNDVVLEVVFDEKENITQYPIYKTIIRPSIPMTLPVYSVKDTVTGNIIYMSGGEEPSEEIKKLGEYTYDLFIDYRSV